MQKLIKKIASFSDDIYRDLPYGTIYYIASEQNIALNNYVKENADDIIAKLNRESSIWISFKLVCLDSKNDYIYSYGNAALYSALIPYKTEPQQNYNFFAAYAEPFSGCGKKGQTEKCGAESHAYPCQPAVERTASAAGTGSGACVYEAVWEERA